MPDLDDNFEDMEPSTVSDLDETAPAPEPAAEPAASSPATGETDEELLSVAQDVIKKSREVPASPAEDSVEEEVSDEPKKPDDEDYTDVPFNKHPRFQHLLRKSKAYEQDALRYRNVESFIQDHGLAAEEAADALVVAGLIKTDPVAAWARMKPIVQQLLIAAGEILPDDIRQRVAAGEMSQEAALEVARSRAAVQSQQRLREFEQGRAETLQQRNLAQSLMDAASSWESDRRQKDPNYAAKEQAVLKEVIYLQTVEGKPNTPEGVKAQLAKAYKTVNASFRPAPAPAAQPVRPAPRLQTQPSPPGKVATGQREMTTLDIIRANRAG